MKLFAKKSEKKFLIITGKVTLSTEEVNPGNEFVR